MTFDATRIFNTWTLRKASGINLDAEFTLQCQPVSACFLAPTICRKLVEPGKDPNRVAAGLKAAVHNPRVSEEAKESATQRLHKMGEDVEPAEEETGTLTFTSISNN